MDKQSNQPRDTTEEIDMNKIERDMNKIHDMCKQHEAITTERLPFEIILDGFSYEVWEPLSAAVEIEEHGYVITAVQH